jgi:hypothetical protein
MIKVNDNETFKNAVTEMMAYRNTRTRRSEKKIKIQSVETDKEIIVEHLTHRFMIGFGRAGHTRFGALRFEHEIWADKIIYNKELNIVTFENAINEDGEDANHCIDLEKSKMTLVSF